MHSFFNKRSAGLALTLTMAMSLLPVPALAAENDGLCSHHSAHTTECGFFNEGNSCSFSLNGCNDCRENLIPIVGTDVLINGTSFPCTGQEIQPEITVTVDGKLLTVDEHYTLTFENNIQPGEATVTVTGLSEGGYQGTVTIAFTITPATQPEDTQKPGENEKPDDSENQDPTEETKPEDTKPVEYKLTKGNGSTWYQGSGKSLSFAASGQLKDLTAVEVNGKALSKSDYSASGNTAVTIAPGYLNKLTVGKYTITIRFADGTAEGTFSVSDKLDTSNPVTGDAFNPVLWALLGTGSLAGLGMIAIMMSKKKQS